MLIEVAAQLNHQLPKAPFNELLEAYGWATPLLRRTPADPARVEAASKRMASEGALVAQRILRRFTRPLGEAVGKAPVLLVLDTLEEVHLRPQGDLDSLLGLLRDLLNECPGLRLILSGRYSVPTILGPAASGVGPMREVQIKPFTSAEADRYLQERRGLEKRAVRNAIVKKAGGRPYVLSLLADLVQSRPSLSPNEISRYPADVILLIRRVVNRIEEPGVRWILRYGVVPRTLSLEFVEKVMQPYLRQAMAGKRSYDAPRRDQVPAEAGAEAQTFGTDPFRRPTPIWTSKASGRNCAVTQARRRGYPRYPARTSR